MNLAFAMTPTGTAVFLDAPRACPICHTAHLWFKRTLMQETMCLDCYGKENRNESL
jgi:hypothetical protein